MRIIRELLERAIHDKEKGMGSYRAEATDEALDFLADMAGGDARAALNAIELGILTTETEWRWADSHYTRCGAGVHPAPCREV